MKSRPWILIVIGFSLFVAAWVTLIFIAGKNPVQPIPITTTPEKTGHEH